MAKTNIKRIQKTLNRVRSREKELGQKIFGKVSMSAASLAIGAYDGSKDATGKPFPQTLLKVPIKIWVAAAFYLGSAFTKGALSRILEGAGDSATSVYQYKVSRHALSRSEGPVFVQGEDDDF